jgi:hypothetical protein
MDNNMSSATIDMATTPICPYLLAFKTLLLHATLLGDE